MNIEERVARRRQLDSGPSLVRDYDALSPAAHVRDPDGRGSVLEQLLDRLEPAFDGDLPGNTYVWGPKGSGKSALVTALFSELGRVSRGARSGIHTTTRVNDAGTIEFAYVDARNAGSEFGLQHAILDALLDEHVPKQGVGSDHLRALLDDRFATTGRRAVVAVDHLGAAGTYPLATVESFPGHAAGSVSWLAVGRIPPEELGSPIDTAVHLPVYQEYVLVDILTSRSSRGLAHHAISHEQLRRIAGWAAGDAHDALAALFGAAVLASEAGEQTIEPATVTKGMDAVPQPTAPIGRVLALPENRQRVLRRLIEPDLADCESIEATAEAIARSEELDLSAATVKRFLYELAEADVLRRVTSERTAGLGRPPSRVEPRFPALVFRRVFDAAYGPSGER